MMPASLDARGKIAALLALASLLAIRNPLRKEAERREADASGESG